MRRSEDQCSNCPNTPPETPSGASSESPSSPSGHPTRRPGGPEDDRGTSPPTASSGPPAPAVSNAFSPEFLDRLRRGQDHPPTPEAANAGPFRVEWLGPDAPSSLPWACFSAGEATARACLADPELAYLLAAVLPLTERAPRFALVEDLDTEEDLYLLVSGFGDQHGDHGTVRGWNENLPAILTALDELRVRPLAVAHFLLSLGDETLRRVGRILAEMASGFGDGEVPR